MSKLVAIAKNTFKEAIRDRILYGFLFFAICLILFSMVLGQLALDEKVRCTLDVGLAGISLFSVIIAIFLGVTLLHKEIEKRTIYPVLSKPVSRGVYLCGKYLGLAAVALVQILLMVVVFWLVLWVQGGDFSAGLAAALLLVFVETLLVLGMALFFTSFSSPFLSGIFCVGIFVAGRNANLLQELGNKKGLEWLAPILDGVTTVLPNLYLFYPSGKMVEGSWATIHSQFVSSGYLMSAVGYGLVYSFVFVALSVFLLGRRDFI